MKKKIMSLLFIMTVWCTSVQGAALDLKSIYSSGMSTKVNQGIISLHKQYSDIMEMQDIGYSAARNIPIKALKLGNGERHILINGQHHGRETMTTLLVLNQIQDLAQAYKNNEMRHGYSVRQLLNTVSLWFVPMTNPDGADLAMSSRPSWKANGRGVDLNRNYPTKYAATISTKSPGSQGYAGSRPFSEPETQAIRNLCEEVGFETTVAYHSAGEIIFWWYHQTGSLYTQSLIEARLLSNITGYSLVPVSQQKGGLGFTDWFIQYYKRPGYTLEIGRTVNARPLAWSEYSKVWRNNKDVPLRLLISTMERETKSWITSVAGKSIQGEAVFGRGMVPVREIASAMNLSISYDSAAKKIAVTRGGNVLTLKLGEKQASYNNETVELVMPAYAREGMTYLPLRDLLSYFSEYEVKPPETVIKPTEEEENSTEHEGVWEEEKTSLEEMPAEKTEPDDEQEEHNKEQQESAYEQEI